MQNPHNELPTHAADGKAKKSDELKENPKEKIALHKPDTDHKKELLEKMRSTKPKE